MVAPSRPIASQSIEIDQCRDERCNRVVDEVAVEEPLEIQLVTASADGAAAKSLLITMRTPGDDIDLSLGFLVSESIITSPDDVAAAELVGPRSDEGLQNTLRIELKPHVNVDLPRLERHFYTTSSCGVCGKASLDALAFTAAKSSGEPFAIDRHRLLQFPDALRERQFVFESTGGLHGAAAFDSNGELGPAREDVGRHNAVDKVVGALLAEKQLPANRWGLLVSGRVSFELVQKALVAGMPMLVAVSAPSSLAVRLAREYDLTLVAFLRDRGFNVYSAPQRVRN